jgi:O-glycosyl hydrolase
MGVLSPADGPDALRGTLVVPKRFWAMANYSHFVGPEWKLIRIDGAGFDNTAFVNPKNNSFAVIVVNSSEKPQTAAYDFGDWTIGAVGAFATTADLNLARTEPPVTQPHRFNATLSPMSVTTFVGELTR